MGVGLVVDDAVGHGGHVGDRWELAPERASRVERLLALGRVGIGGFVDGGVAEGEAGRPWLLRAPLQPMLASRLVPTPSDDWRREVGLVVEIARCLAAAEERGVYPGPIGPKTVVLGESGAWIRAEQLIASSLGRPPKSTASASEFSREWLTPAGARGEPEGPGDNRWRLGLLLYRLLAGRGPFAGLGLRSAIDRLERGVPPLPESVASQLPHGLQAKLLAILHPDPDQRPQRASAIADDLEGFLGGAPKKHRTVVLRHGRRETATLESDTAESQPESQFDSQSVSAGSRLAGPNGRVAEIGRGRERVAGLGLLAVVATIVIGVAGAIGILRATETDRVDDARAEAPAPKPTVGRRPPLDAEHTSPEDCAGCHPRQTAEWKRSVMGHAAKSPLFQSLEILIQEQVGRSDDCPGGAGALRTVDPSTACRDPNTGLAITGSGGELWCANCHTPRENLAAALPAWDGRSSRSATRHPLRDLQAATTTEGIDCGFCHQVHGPVSTGPYQGNPSWLSTATGQRFAMRPEDRTGLTGIANSGYELDPRRFLASAGSPEPAASLVPGGAHRRVDDDVHAYLQSSQFCGACHDVRLFGSDAVATPATGQHFRRLRNAYSEWDTWARAERLAGREPADCQDCHMSSFPGVCVDGPPPPPVPGETDLSALRRGCPPGTHFESRRPGERPSLRVAAASAERTTVTTHYFSGVDIPLTPEFDRSFVDQPELDAAGIPLGGEQRRDLLLGRSFRFAVGDEARTVGGRLEIPIEIENTGAGHKIPAGFSQEREFWVHLRVTDANGALVYEVGRVDRGDEDLRDKVFVKVNVSDRARFDPDSGSPLGVFGADVVDGPDVPQWEALDGNPSSELRQPAPTRFRGRGLINLQNGFLRCVQCIGFVDGEGECQPANQAQTLHRAARFDDARFDLDTGECDSNLEGDRALFEIYFPVGSLDARRGVIKGPDAIIDVRSAPPGQTMRWLYELELEPGHVGPLTVEARLLFRAFPPFLVRAFADYEALQAAGDNRPSGPLVTRDMLDKLDVVEIATVTRTIER